MDVFRCRLGDLFGDCRAVLLGIVMAKKSVQKSKKPSGYVFRKRRREKALREMIGAVDTDNLRRRIQGKFRKWQHELTRRVADCR